MRILQLTSTHFVHLYCRYKISRIATVWSDFVLSIMANEASGDHSGRGLLGVDRVVCLLEGFYRASPALHLED